MSTESRHVLLVCSAPRHPSPALLEHPAVGRLSVVTEHGHVHDYGPRVAVETVEDIGDVEAVRRAAARLFAHAPVDAVVSNVGAGDASLAGFVLSGGLGQDALAGALAHGAAAVRLPGSAMPAPGDLFRDAVTVTSEVPVDHSLSQLVRGAVT